MVEPTTDPTPDAAHPAVELGYMSADELIEFAEQGAGGEQPYNPQLFAALAAARQYRAAYRGAQLPPVTVTVSQTERYPPAISFDAGTRHVEPIAVFEEHADETIAQVYEDHDRGRRVADEEFPPMRYHAAEVALPLNSYTDAGGQGFVYGAVLRFSRSGALALNELLGRVVDQLYEVAEDPREPTPETGDAADPRY
jgi:hypothetical protein